MRTYGPVLWHLLYGSEGARGPIIAESGGSPWLHPGSRGRDAPRLEDSLVAEYLLYPSQKGQSAVYSVWLEGRWPILLPCVSLQIVGETSASRPYGRRTRLPRESQVTNPNRPLGWPRGQIECDRTPKTTAPVVFPGTDRVFFFTHAFV